MSTAPGSDGVFTIVVGLSPRSGSPGALRWAVEEAGQRQGRVVAVRAWSARTPETSTGGRLQAVHPSDEAALEDARTALLSDVAAVLGIDHLVQTRLVVGGRRTALVEASREADLLVIDAGRGAEVGARWLGSRLVRQAYCPVVVMPPLLADRGETKVVERARALGRSVERAAGTAGRPGLHHPMPRVEHVGAPASATVGRPAPKHAQEADPAP